MKKLISWHQFLERRPYRVTISSSYSGGGERTLIVTNPRVASAGLEAGWRVTRVERYNPSLRVWEDLDPSLASSLS